LAEPVNAVRVAVDPRGTTGSLPAPAAPAQPPAAAGRYSLGEEIARGGMGAVYRATDTMLDREVAVKVLREKYGPDSGVARRFAAEARITAQLQHPNIPAIHDLGTLPDGRPFLAMKLIKGETLDHLLRQRADPAVDHGRFVAVFEQVCQAVAYAHAHDVIHRDLKPANVMVGRFGDVQVMDWGLAKVLGARAEEPTDPDATTAPTAMVSLRESDEAYTRAGSVLGTPPYMPPEQAAGAVGMIDRRSDVFGLGAVLAVVLTGRPPFLADTSESTRVKAAVGDLGECFARLDRCGTDPDLVAVCKRCLAPRPEDRPTDAGEVARAVAAIRSAADERARQAEAEARAAEARMAEQGKRRRILLAAGGTIALALLAGLGVSLGQMRRAMQAEAQAENRSAELADVNGTLRREKYIADMNLARVSWDDNNLIRTRELLEQHRPKPGEADLRGFEWHYLRRLFEQQLWIIRAHGGAALTVAWTPDGKQLITSGAAKPGTLSSAGEVKLWDAETCRRLPLELKGLQDNMGAVALSADGRFLAAGRTTSVVCVWDLQSGDYFTLDGSGKRARRPASVSFSPDGKRLASRTAYGADLYSNQTEITIWDLTTRKAIAAIKDLPSGRRAIFSPDGKYLAGPHLYAGVQVWDAVTGREALAFEYGNGEYADIVAFHPDGKRLAVCTEKNDIVVFDLTTRQRVATWSSASTGHSLLSLAFSPDGTRAAGGSLDGLVELWDTQTGQRVDMFRGHVGGVESVAFSPEGTRLASSGIDGSVRLWDINRQRAALSVPTFVVGRAFPSLELSPDGQNVLTGVGSTAVRLWSTATGKLYAGPFEHQHQVQCANLTPDGKRLIVADKGKLVRIWNVAARKEICTFGYDTELGGSAGYITTSAISPDGKWYALPAKDGTIRLYDTTTGAPGWSLKSPPTDPGRLEFSPDSSRLVAADLAGDTVRVWDVATGQEFATFTVSGITINRVRFSPDGRHLAVAGFNFFTASDARIVDLDGGHPVVLKGHALAVLDVAFSPDGERVVTASTDRTIRVWDRATGQELLMLNGHTRAVTGIRFSPDGHRLISASADRTVRVWDATPLPD
jgi:WD40 repeat protein/tRNA A-37 threonylcarbamoyl transferase component Bud32